MKERVEPTLDLTAGATSLGPDRARPGSGRVETRKRRGNYSRLARITPFLVAIVAAVSFIVMTDGGRSVRHTPSISGQLDTWLGAAGLGLNEITISGQKQTSDKQIYAKLDIAGTKSIWMFDAAAARQRIETLPWIDKSSVKRIFPDRLHIEIKERVAVARWRRSDHEVLIDRAGRELGRPRGSKRDIARLPLFVGEGAGEHAHAIHAAVMAQPDLNARIMYFERVAGRRWTLHLKDGVAIHLPAKKWDVALIRMMRGIAGQRLFDKKFSILDLRIPEQHLLYRTKSRKTGRGQAIRARKRKKLGDRS